MFARMRSVFIVAAATLLSSQMTGGEMPATFRSADCPVQFHYPRTWRARALRSPQSNDGPTCVVVVDPPNWNHIRDAAEFELEDHAIRITVYRAAFPETASKGRFFLFEDGKWRIVGRGNDFPVAIKTNCCFGLRGHMTYGRFKKGGVGGYQGLGEYDHAILGNARNSVVVSAPGGDTSVFEGILESLKTN
jgi:hypothetical protein